MPTNAPPPELTLVEVSLIELGFTTPAEVFQVLNRLEGSIEPEPIRRLGYALLAPTNVHLDGKPERRIKEYVEQSSHATMLCITWSYFEESSFWALRRCRKGRRHMDFIWTPDQISMDDMLVIARKTNADE